MENTNLKPVVRFPEFTENWVTKRTGEIAPLQRGFDLPTTEVIEGDFPVVYSNGILRKHNTFKVEGPGVVTGRSGTIGKVSYVEENFWPHNTSLWVTDFKNNDPKFIYYFYSIFNLERFSGGSTVPTLNRNDVHLVKKNIPSSKGEQQKIADFLTSIDNRVTLLKEKKDTLEAYKKGIKQKLFNQEIRFKDDKGNDFPDWEESKFHNHYEFKNTNSLSRENLNYESGKVKNIHYGDIHTKFNTHFDVNKDELPFINEDVDISRIDNENYVLNGDLVMADASEDYADIGKTIEITNTNNEKILAGLHTFLARKTDKTLASGFFGHLLTNYNIRLELMRIAQGTKVLGLSKGRVEKISLTIPTPKEQTKIANYLSAIDTKIEALQQKIDSSLEFKKGLLQKMFV